MEGSGGIPISPLRTLQTSRNPLETATAGAHRPGVEPPPISPPENANIIFPIRLTVLAFIRPDYSRGKPPLCFFALACAALAQGFGTQNKFCRPFRFAMLTLQRSVPRRGGGIVISLRQERACVQSKKIAPPRKDGRAMGKSLVHGAVFKIGMSDVIAGEAMHAAVHQRLRNIAVKDVYKRQARKTA